MPSRLSEVVYRLKDLFTEPTGRVIRSYGRLRGASASTRDAVEKDTRRMSGVLATLGGALRSSFAVLGGGAGGFAATGGISRIADELDRLGKTAGRLDIDPGTLSALEFAADRSGVSVGKMSASIETLQKRTGEALQGIGRAKIAFDRLGISAEDFAKLGADEQLVVIANALQSVTSEEERAAIASQLFSKANVDLLNVLNQGGPALEGLVQQGRDYLNVTTKQTKAAADFNDALSNLSRQTDGIKFQFATPIISELSEFFDNIGFGDKVKGLTTELLLLENRLKKPLVFNRSGVEDRVNQIRLELSAIRERTKAAEDSAKKEATSRRESVDQQTKADSDHKESIRSVTSVLQERAKAQKDILSKESAELRAARSEQAQIENEFKSLAENIATPEVDDVSLADVFLSNTRARAAAERGEIDEAIAFARQGADLLGKLKEEGTETSGTLGFLAGQLQEVANQAAGQKVDAELIDEQQAQEAVANVKEQLEVLKSEVVKAGQEAGTALVASMSAAILEASGQLKAAGTQAGADYVNGLKEQLATEVEAPAVRAPQVSRQGNSFTDGTDFREAVDRRGSR